MTSPTAELEQVIALLAPLSPSSLLDEALVSTTIQLEAVGRLVDALRMQCAGEIDLRSEHELGKDSLSYRLGQKRPEHLLEELTHVSQRTAVSRIRMARNTRGEVSLTGEVLPGRHSHVAEALVSGEIGIDSAAVIIRCMDAAARVASLGDIADAEAQLVQVAREKSADHVEVFALVAREVLDPDGAPQRTEELYRRRTFRIGRESRGMTPFSGVCSPEDAALLRAAMVESNAPDTKPRFLAPEDWIDDRGLVDPRTREQRQHDVLFGMIRAGMAAPMSMRSMATVNVVIMESDLVNGTGVGWLEDVKEPVSVGVVREMECEAAIFKTLVGENGRIIAQSVPDRYFTAYQRRALAVRDGGCVWPGCTAPPAWCIAHHIEEHQHGGPTDNSNGVLLCPAHHRQLHQSPFEMCVMNEVPMLLAPPWIDASQTWRRLGRNRALELARARGASSQARKDSGGSPSLRALS